MSLTVGQILKSVNKETGDVTHRIKFGNIPNSKIKVEFPIVINEGDTLFLNKPTDRLEYLLKEGKISQEKYEELVGMYQDGGKLDFVRYEVKEPVSSITTNEEAS